MKLTEKEKHTLSLALSIAADAYDQDAANSPFPRISEQFKKQATEARGLAERIDTEEEVQL